MPWYLPWSESIKNRLSRYLLQRYLGQFLEEKLTLDQLTVDLYNGTGTVQNVKLDVQALNELGEQQNLPIEFVDGFISEVSVSIPWSSILRDGSYVEVLGLVITVQPKQRTESGTSMFESMWNSMTSSMQLAEECLKQGNAESKDTDQPQPLEGLELFAQTIDSILSRVKVKFVNTTIRLEHVPKDSSSGVAVELRIKHMDYLDEAGTDPPTPPATDVQLQQGNKMYQVAAFSTKKFHLEGVTLYTDEYPSIARTFSRSVMSLSATSTPDSKHSESNFGTAPATPTSSSPSAEHLLDDTSTHSNMSLEPDPILFGRLSGRQEVRIKLRQSEGIIGPKVDMEINLGALTTFISPRQLHVLLELLHGLSSPDIEDTSNVPRRTRCSEKPMDPTDFNRVEQELQHQLNPDDAFHNKGLQYTQGWSTASLDDSDDEFLPMRGLMNESLISNATSMDGSISSIGSSASSKSGSFASTSSRSANVFSRTRKRSHKMGTSILDADPTAEVSHFHVRLSSLAVVLLHEDVLTLCVERDGHSLAHSSVQQMKTLAQNFFAELGFFAVSAYGHKDFDQAKEIFLKACQLNHIRLLAAPVIVEGNEKTTSHASSVGFTLTAASLELLECLIDRKTQTQKGNVEYVELLKFMRSTASETDPQPTFTSQPDLKLELKYLEKAVNLRQSRRSSHPRTDVALTLQKCWSEVDLSIVDRITAVLNPQPLCKRSTFTAGATSEQFNQQCFYQAVENPVLPESSVHFKLYSPYVLLKLRFPCPDLRPIHDMDRPPWWKRSVRKDILNIELTDASFQTIMHTRQLSKKFELQCRDILGSFLEADTDSPVPFIQSSVDDKNGNSLPDGGQGFGWPRIVVQIFPANTLGELEEIPERETEDPMRFSTTETFVTSGHKEPSPFSSKRVIHESDTPHGKTTNQEGEELVIPGDKAELAEFIDHASRNSRIQVEVNLPCTSLQLSSKHLYEVIYNRISTDMLLWEPAAPKPKTSFPTDVYIGSGPMVIDLATSLIQESLYPAFSMCKSGAQYDSDSESDENEGVYYSVYEHRQRHKRKQQITNQSESGQSKVTVTVTISQGLISLHAPVRDSGKNVIPGQHGEIQIQLEDGNIFAVSGYKGKTGLGFVCVQVNQAGFYHSGLLTTPVESTGLKMPGNFPPSHLDPTIYKSEAGSIVNSSNVGLDMLTVSIKIQTDEETHHLKNFRVAVALRGATLRHRMCRSANSWFTQLLDLFDVTDYPVPGYDPPGVVTELHLHLWDCAVDYRPLYIPLKTMITMGSFTVSSNIAAQTSSSTLRFIAEDASLFISNKTKNSSAPVNLRRDYVCVLDLGLFELSLRLCDKTNSLNSANPRVDLRASNNILHIRTCSDSGRALTELLTYFASDGDLISVDDQCSQTTSSSISADPILINTGDNTLDNNQNGSNNLSKSQTEHVHDLMEEAMKETNGAQKLKSQKSQRNKKGVEVFFFPDENHPLPNRPLTETEISQTIDMDDDDDDWEEEFCMVDKEAGSGIMTNNGLPEIRILTKDPVRVIDNHFSVPMGKTDLLKAPKHYPDPVLRYTLREMTIVWHIYGGEDFSAAKSAPVKKVHIEDNSTSFASLHQQHDILRGGVSFSKSSPGEVRFKPQTHLQAPHSPKAITNSSKLSWQARGGPGRQHDELMELQLNKVRFQHEVYPENTTEASRQVLLINDVEIRDRLASSQINKFLYQYSSEARPKQSHANMILIKAVHIRPDPKLRVQECCLKVSLLPLRLNIDQDSLLFLFTFFNELSEIIKEEEECLTRHTTPTHQPPVMTVNVDSGPSEPATAEPQALLIMLEEDSVNPESRQASPLPPVEVDNQEKPPVFPIFFRSFIFSPEVPIRLDYQGKHVDMTHGPLAGLLMGLGQLNCSELRLKRLSYRHGLLGFDKLVAFIMAEWLNDIKKNQLPSLLGGVGPMHALVQLFQGIRDLFWLPIEQYQKDGRIVRGLQRGANSFTTSTAMAALELANRLVQAIQSTAEMAYDMVSPGPSVRRRSHGSKGRKRRYKQPADIREGMANAYMLVKEGLGETAQTIVRVANEEHDQKGVSGAVGGVLRQIPPTVVKPIILATEATSNLLGGMRSQLVPDARREAVEKWRNE